MLYYYNNNYNIITEDSTALDITLNEGKTFIYNC